MVNDHCRNFKAENRMCDWTSFSGNWKSRIPEQKSDDVTISWTKIALKLFREITCILVTIFAFYKTKQNCWKNENHCLNKTDEETNSKADKNFLFRFSNGTFRHEYTVYPLSLQQYFKDANNSPGKSTVMNYEWARYKTFQTFPEKSPVTPMRLARAGFYYAGDGEEATCFSCELKNQQWSCHEAVFDTHKRLSPNCPFIKGTDETNVPIHVNESNVEVTDKENGACGGPRDARTECSNIERSTYHTDKQIGQSNNANSGESTTKKSLDAPGSDFYSSGSIEKRPRYNREEPKHPDFAIKSQRMSTFSNWPSSHPIRPAQLTEAGFFFTGHNDIVRCFFCGGGMQSWRHGDSPWIEHARWYPTCAYVRQFKGDNFVNKCRAAHLDQDTYNQLSDVGYDENMSSASSDFFMEDMYGPVAACVLNMGYSQEQVKEAIKDYRHRQGSAELKAQHLLEFLLDNKSTPSEPGTVTKNTITSSRHRENTSMEITENKQSLASSSKDTDQNPLAAENTELKEKMLCKICFDNDANIVFLPCGHMVSCVECAYALRKCAVCRKLIDSRIRTYLS
ncbi:Baculoviral IAP [Mactra antiquata]